MTDHQRLEYALRKLRHAYEQLIHGHVYKTQEAHVSLANGLLSPAIADIERFIADNTIVDGPPTTHESDCPLTRGEQYRQCPMGNP